MVGATTTANIGKVATGPGGASYPLFSGALVRREKKCKHPLLAIARSGVRPIMQSSSSFRDAVRRFRITEHVAARLPELRARRFSEAEDEGSGETYREEPNTHWESMFHSSVASGAGEGKPISKFKAKKEPFLGLEKDGWVKHHISREQPGGGKSVIHYWQSPTGERKHLKFKDD